MEGNEPSPDVSMGGRNFARFAMPLIVVVQDPPKEMEWLKDLM